MSTPPTTTTVVTSSLNGAYGHALAQMVPVIPGRGGREDILIFTGEGETPNAALADAVAAIRDLAETHGAAPSEVQLDGSLRADEGYRLWGTIRLGNGVAPDDVAMDAWIEQGEEGTWTVTITRN